VVSEQWVLVAEDNPRVLELWQEALTEAGYHVLRARNGRDALALMRAIVPHCIVLDLRMPEISGAELLTLTRAAPARQPTPIIVVSGFLDEHAEVLRTTRFNVVMQLQKPVSPAAIVEAVEAALASARSAHLGDITA
jgi:DNA-binding response OmpR family regulator